MPRSKWQSQSRKKTVFFSWLLWKSPSKLSILQETENILLSACLELLENIAIPLFYCQKIKLACSGVIKFYFTQNYLEELKFDVHIQLADSET